MNRFWWKSRMLKLIALLILVAIAAVIVSIDTKSGGHSSPSKIVAREGSNASTVIAACKPSKVQLAFVVCGNRTDEALTMLKSVIMSSKDSLTVHIIAENHLWEEIENQMDQWNKVLKLPKIDLHLYEIKFPPGQEVQWKRLFKPCACQRLFLPDILTDIDSVIYVDTDVIFLRSIQDLWSLFDHFNVEQIAGLSSESEDPSANWYIRFARHPFMKPYGVNSGVMMMNLTRMREFDWTQRMWPIYKKYQTALTWGDQDIINIVFAGNPEKLYVFDCAWNYRPDHCMYMSVCKRSKQDGAFIVHGSRGFSHSDKQPPFKLLYEAFQRFRAEKDDLATNLVQPLQNALAGLDTSKSNCAKVYNIFLKQLMSRTKTQL